MPVGSGDCCAPAPLEGRCAMRQRRIARPVRHFFGAHALGGKHVIRPPYNERSPRRLRCRDLRRQETETERERRIESQRPRERGRLLGERENELKTLREGGGLSVRFPLAEGHWNRINMVMEEEASMWYLSNSIISCSTSNRATNYGNKFLYT